MKIKTIASLLALAALLLSARAADPKETVGSAIKALQDKANYSWSTISEMENAPFPPTTTKGKTEKDGYSLLTSERQDGEVQAARRGEKGVLKTDEGWKTLEDLRQSGEGQGRGRGFFRSQMLAAPTPAIEAEELLKDVKELKAGDGGIYAADLSEQAAKDRAGFFGRRGGRGGQGAPEGFTPPEPKDAKGTVKFWVKDGLLIKYQLSTSAKMTFQGEERDMNRTATTDISAIDSTKFEVPDEAKKKL